LQYWILRVLRAFPPKARSRVSLAFVFNAPHRTKTQARSTAARTFSQLSEEKLINLEYTQRTQFRPRFLYSCHPDAVRINHIFKTALENQFIIVDGCKRVRRLTVPSDANSGFQNSVLCTLPCAVSSGCCSPEFNSDFVLGFDSGRINRYATDTATAIPLGQLSGETFAMAMAPISRSLVLVGATDGSASLFDWRETESAPTRTVPGLTSHLQALTVWPNGAVIAAFGYAAGVVSVLDLRMWMPLWIDKTAPVGRIVAMAHESPALSYLVLNPKCAEVVAVPRFKPQARSRVGLFYREEAVLRLALPYLGGAVVVDDLSAAFIQGNGGYPNVRLHDTGVSRLTMRAAAENARIVRVEDEQAGLSVHQHSGAVTCGVMCRDVAVTCDDAGFIHQWRLDPDIVWKR
jgi:hypothetical protein